MSAPLYPTPHVNTANTNTNAVITLAAIGGSRRSVEQIIFSHSADPASATVITVESPSGTVLQSFHVTKGGPGFIAFGKPGCVGALGQALVIRGVVSATAAAALHLGAIEGNV